MALNAEDGGNRRCLSVQLPEPTDEKSEARKAGYANIAEITRERIRRAGAKILEEESGKLDGRAGSLDVGSGPTGWWIRILRSGVRTPHCPRRSWPGCLLGWVSLRMMTPARRPC